MISYADVKKIEEHFNNQLGKFGYQCLFHGHFVRDSLNHERNKPLIFRKEFTNIIARMFVKGRDILNGMKDNQEGTVRSVGYKISMPFVMKKQGNYRVIVPKTIMRKEAWGNDNPKYKNDIIILVESMTFEEFISLQEALKVFNDSII